MSRLAETHDNIRGSWSILQGQWTETRRQWRDSVGERFEREMWQEWEDDIPQVLQAMQDLDEILNQALQQTDRD